MLHTIWYFRLALISAEQQCNCPWYGQSSIQAESRATRIPQAVTSLHSVAVADAGVAALLPANQSI